MEITVTAKFATFEPATITVAKGQTVKLTVTSTDTRHTFTIDELGIDIAVGAGQTATKEFTVEQAGTFAFYCAVPGHRGAGMEGTLKATE
jgi:nitrite reductase (NO-forming)